MVTRPYDEEYFKYMRKILAHPNYSGIPSKDRISSDSSNEELKSNWVVIKDSDPVTHAQREQWWDNKRQKFGIEKKKGWLTDTVRANFPFPKRPCQTCGKYLYPGEVYPSFYGLKRFNKIKQVAEGKYDLDVDEIIKIIAKSPDGLDQVKKSFSIPDSIEKKSSTYSDFIKKNRKTFLTAGSWGDPPDRLDGFHSYNNCCRKTQDTGRHDENMNTYNRDRRARELWSDGDFKTADWLMREFTKRGLSADHIGPISQGFVHDPVNFAAISLEDNITKRDNLRIVDLKMLLEDEQKEKVVMSWHTKHTWDLLKNLPRTEKESVKLGKVLKQNVHNVLALFFKIKKGGFAEFLVQFLHPDFALYQPKFTKIDLETRTYEYTRKPASRKEQKDSREDGIRISLETLDEYDSKKNRRVKLWKGEDIDECVKKIFENLKRQDNEGAKAELDSLFTVFSEYAKKEYEKS